MAMIADLRKELEREAEEENIPILRRAERKLLLTRKELRRWERKVNETGLTIIITKLFINDRGLAKVEVALARGKRQYDKRDALRKRDHAREIDLQVKERGKK